MIVEVVTILGGIAFAFAVGWFAHAPDYGPPHRRASEPRKNLVARRYWPPGKKPIPAPVVYALGGVCPVRGVSGHETVNPDDTRYEDATYRCDHCGDDYRALRLLRDVTP